MLQCRGMRKKRKRGSASDLDAQPNKPTKVPAVATGIGALLTRAGLDRVTEPRPSSLPPPAPARPSLIPEPPPAEAPRPRPKAELSAGDFAALNQAYRGVAPIARPKRERTAASIKRAARPPAVAEDPAARERLSALVAGGQRFRVERDDAWVQGVRADVTRDRLKRLSGARFAPEATLDLHGYRREEAARQVAEFIRMQHRRGARYLLIIVGKGTHSENGIGVLGTALVEELIGGVAAPLVAAFASAHPQHGGSGAVAIQLG